MNFYPYKKKGGGGQRFRLVGGGGGGMTSFGVVLTQELEVLAIGLLKGGDAKSFLHKAKGGGAQNVLSCLHRRWRGHNKIWTHAFSHF